MRIIASGQRQGVSTYSTTILLLGIALLAGCGDRPDAIGVRSPVLSSAFSGADTIWNDVSDEMMWEYIARADTQVTVGIKDPTAARGLERGQPTASLAQRIDAFDQLQRNVQLRMVFADSTHIPIARLRPRTLEALRVLRRLPFVDFVEPANIEFKFASGCSSPGYTGGRMAALPGGSQGGWDTVSSVYRGMNIPNMWKLSAGQGVEVGLVDTGVDPGTPDSEYDKQRWWIGHGRTLTRLIVYPSAVYETYAVPPCNHGTRMAGVALAPNNGTNVVGIAHRSGLISAEVNDQVWYTANAERTAGGVHHAAIRNAKVIIMAFGGSPSNELAYEIQSHFYNDDVVFVGAAGTGTQVGCCSAFPASMSEVIAATGAAHNGFRPRDVYDVGSKYPAALATTFLLTTQNGNPSTVELAGSSGATAIIGGLAAAVRSFNPSFSANQVYERIVRTSGDDCGAPWAWYPLINASAAVGGPCVTYIRHGRLVFYVNETHDFTTSAVRRFADGYFLGGSGNYSVQWITTGGAIENGSPVNSNTTDASGNYVWQTAQNYRFAATGDGQPYNFVISARIQDNVLGTVDVRVTDTLRVCANSSNCYATTRLYPGVPGPSGPSVSISGPSAVHAGQPCEWYALASGGTPPYAYSWKVNGQPDGDGTSLLQYTNSGASFTLSVTVTDQVGLPGTAEVSIAVQSGSYCL